MKTRLVIASGVLGLVFAALATLLTAQDPVKVSPGKYRVVFENERVRLLEYHDKPGDVSPMHDHPANLIYVMNSGKRKFTFRDGKSVVADLKAGDAIWSDGESHAGENVGTADTHVLIFELKEPRR